MTPYEELIEQMRKAGRFYNPQVPEMGIMGHDGRVKIGSGIIKMNDTEEFVLIAKVVDPV